MSSPHEQRELIINSISEANALLSPSANATPEQFYDAVIYLLGQAAFGRIGRGILLKLYEAGSFRMIDDVLVVLNGNSLDDISLTSDEIVYMKYVESRTSQ